MVPLKDEAGTLDEALRRLFQTVKRPQYWAYITAQAGVDIDRPAAAILHVLMSGKAGECHVRDLANRLGIEAPSITRKTQELERAGLLERVADPADKRAVGLRVTAKGKKVAKRLQKAQKARLCKVLDNWSATERKQFIKFLQRYSEELAAQPNK